MLKLQMSAKVACAVAAALAGLAVAPGQAAGTWVRDNSTNICGSNTTLGNAVIAALNLTYPGLEGVAAAAGAGDLNGACEALAVYYQTSGTANWLRLANTPIPSNKLAGGVVDEMVFNDTFFLSGVGITAKVPRNADGGWVLRLRKR